MQLLTPQPDMPVGNGALAEMSTSKSKQELPLNAAQMSEMDAIRDPLMSPHSGRNTHELSAINT